MGAIGVFVWGAVGYGVNIHQLRISGLRANLIVMGILEG
jgi:hypothetical protein